MTKDTPPPESQLDTAANLFQITSPIRIYPLGEGLIHQTVRVDTVKDSYVLQKLNHDLFPNLEDVMHNMCLVLPLLRAPALELIPTRTGQFWHKNKNGSSWRMTRFIPNSVCYQRPRSPRQAQEGAKAFGHFLNDLSHLEPKRLSETLPGFHDTKLRYKQFKQALRNNESDRLESAEDAVRFAINHEHLSLLLNAFPCPTRVTHNDTKFNNCLLNEKTDEALCAIDLDTVMPGLLPVDFGDMAVSFINRSAYDEHDLSRVDIDLDLFKGVATGFIHATEEVITEDERSALVPATQVITYELGLRFLTDYLNGDRYFKNDYPDHSLYRTRVMFELVRQLQKNEGAMHRVMTHIS